MYGDGKLFWILPKYQFNYIIHRGFPLDTLDPREGQHLILANIGFIRIHWSGATLRPISTRDLSEYLILQLLYLSIMMSSLHGDNN